METVEEAVKLHHDLTTLWKRAGMTSEKWLSNSEEVLKVIPKDCCVSNLDLEAQVIPVIYKNVGGFLGIKFGNVRFRSGSSTT